MWVTINFKKLLILLLRLLIVLIALVVVLFTRILKPLLLIRFGGLSSRRIGHYVGNTEIYLCERDFGVQNTRAIDLFFNRGVACNKQLKKMYSRILKVYPFVRYLNNINKFIPGGDKHNITLSTDRDLSGLMRKTESHLFFTNKEEYLGKQYLKSKGINERNKFLCLYARSNHYLAHYKPNKDWSYHDYRNSTIDNYLKAAEVMTKRGYYVFRMGSIVNKKLKTNNSKIIDYAYNGDRTDFLDIFLLAKCQFFLVGSGGPSAVSSAFRRPLAVVNYIPLEYPHALGVNDISIPKKLWLKRENRFITFREIIKAGAGRFIRTVQHGELGLKAIENTPDEIADLAIEMDERLKGNWIITNEDEELQKRFWDIIPESDLIGEIKGIIGTQFLRQNKILLD